MRLFKFKDVIGNDAIKNILIKSLLSHNFPQFTILCGESGTGKSTCAEISALRLVCSSPNGEEPCGECPECRSAMASILHKGESRRVKKINLATISDKEDIQKLIREVFRIDSGSENIVYIFEEAHTLSALHQTALLEEVDRMPENVYVILCTTKPSALLTELKNRAIQYRFSRLTPSSARLLLDRECIRLHAEIPKNIKNKILSYCHGVPRQIVLNVENYVKIGACSEKDLDALFGIVDTNELRLLLKSYTDLSQFLTNLEVVLENSNVSDFLTNLKSYLMECCFLAEDLSYRETFLSPEDKRFAQEVGFGALLKIYNELHKVPYNASLDDVKFTLIVACRILQKSMKSKLANEGISMNISSTQKDRESKSIRKEKLEDLNNFTPLSSSLMEERLDENLHS